MKLNPTVFAYIFGIILTETASQFCVKQYYDNQNKWPLFLIAWLLYALVLFFLYKSYSYTNFALTNALWDSGTIIAMALVGYFYYKDKFNTGEIVGMTLVITGAILLGYYGEGVETEKQK